MSTDFSFRFDHREHEHVAQRPIRLFYRPSTDYFLRLRNRSRYDDDESKMSLRVFPLRLEAFVYGDVTPTVTNLSRRKETIFPLRSEKSFLLV